MRRVLGSPNGKRFAKRMRFVRECRLTIPWRSIDGIKSVCTLQTRNMVLFKEIRILHIFRRAAANDDRWIGFELVVTWNDISDDNILLFLSITRDAIFCVITIVHAFHFARQIYGKKCRVRIRVESLFACFRKVSLENSFFSIPRMRCSFTRFFTKKDIVTSSITYFPFHRLRERDDNKNVFIYSRARGAVFVECAFRISSRRGGE